TKLKIINITPTNSIDLISISKLINEFSNYKSKIVIKNKNLNYEYTGNNSVLLQEIKNFKFSDYKKGIAKLYSSIKSHNEFC
ncbi:MAG: hypothetical protein IKN42_07815, partial [Elusimicrobia bacterium]|nr:hypothetical protein [Elusimicrobiota bacterium]